jgi:hypothetical protein
MIPRELRLPEPLSGLAPALDGRSGQDFGRARVGR